MNKFMNWLEGLSEKYKTREPTVNELENLKIYPMWHWKFLYGCIGFASALILVAILTVK